MVNESNYLSHRVQYIFYKTMQYNNPIVILSQEFFKVKYRIGL